MKTLKMALSESREGLCRSHEEAHKFGIGLPIRWMNESILRSSIRSGLGIWDQAILPGLETPSWIDRLLRLLRG